MSLASPDLCRMPPDVAMTSNAPLSIDVVSDVVCPWCYIGKRLLEKAIALTPEIPVAVRFRPYFLNPWIPREGISREEYLTAKQNGRIITSLESDITPSKPPRQERGFGKESEAALTEIVRMSEHVRGSSAIQSAAVGLLRASARVAQSTAQEPDDLEELTRSVRQVRTALTRLQKALERAED